MATPEHLRHRQDPLTDCIEKIMTSIAKGSLALCGNSTSTPLSEIKILKCPETAFANLCALEDWLWCSANTVLSDETRGKDVRKYESFLYSFHAGLLHFSDAFGKLLNKNRQKSSAKLSRKDRCMYRKLAKILTPSLEGLGWFHARRMIAALSCKA
jgi:hypothetical protein